MRLTSDMFVSALIRRVSASGGFGAVINVGNSEAGAIFVMGRARDGQLTLFAPAPQASYDDAKPQERSFMTVLETFEQSEADAKIEREMRFDSDIWVIEIEPGSTPVSQLLTIVEG